MSEGKDCLDDQDSQLYDSMELQDANETTSESKVAGVGSHITLDLSLAVTVAAAKDEMTDNIQESTKLVIFDLPDGSQGEGYFKLGQTVEYLKSFVELEFGIPMNSQKLFLEDELMMDPYSLLDFPEAKGVDEIFIRVEGQFEKEFKK